MARHIRRNTRVACERMSKTRRVRTKLPVESPSNPHTVGDAISSEGALRSTNEPKWELDSKTIHVVSPANASSKNGSETRHSPT